MTRALLLGFSLVGLLCACRPTYLISGRVEDLATGAPIGGAYVIAAQSGWGFSNGLVWDKDLSDTTRTGESGEFTLRYRAGPVVTLRIVRDGFNAFGHGFEPRAGLVIRLKALTGAARLPSGFLRVGTYTSGGRYGWDFSRGAIATDSLEADLFPERIGPGSHDDITLAARGGIQCRSSTAMGVDDNFLVLGDSAPRDGYAPRVALDFSGGGGLCFGRTRDGAHYFKFAFTPFGFGSVMDPGVARDLSLQYVYNPGGSPALPFDVRPILPARARAGAR